MASRPRGGQTCRGRRPVPVSGDNCLSRLAARGVLENDGGGRASRYRFTSAARERLVVGNQQVTEFGGDPSASWDHRWTAVAFSVPETDRDIREAFRARLRWLGFAPPIYGALWFSPPGIW